MATKKKEAVETEIIGLDGSKQVIKNPKKTTSRSKKTKEEKVVKEQPIVKESKPKTTSKSKTKTSTRKKINEEALLYDKELDATNPTFTNTEQVDNKEIELEKLIDQFANKLIEKFSKVFIKVEDAQQLVISTIQKLAIGELRGEDTDEATAPEMTE